MNNSRTKKIVYIGDKKVKKIVRGSKLRFPQGEPVEVDEQLAYDLLEHTSVFATESDAAELIKERKAKEDKVKADIEARKKLEEETDLNNSYRVIIDGEVKDISKLPKAKLATIIASEGLEIDVNKPEIKDGENGSVDAVRNRVREALHLKSGNPDSEQGE